MASVLRVSDAASIGLHATVLLAANRDRLLSNADIAEGVRPKRFHRSVAARMAAWSCLSYYAGLLRRVGSATSARRTRRERTDAT